MALKRRPRRASTINLDRLKKRERIKVRTNGETQILTLVTTEYIQRGTPKDLSGAIQNALQELFGHVRSNRKPFRAQTIEIFLKHLKDRLAQDFQTAMMTGTDAETLILKTLFERIFPPKAPKDTEGPSGSLRSA